jgi:predicted nuclease of predicted toxin-antitoxin system
MRFLLDQNLSPRLKDALLERYPGTIHVRDVGLQFADDEAIWSYAAQNGFTIASKDADFRQRSFLFGQPPRVVWIRMGNCSTSEIESILEAQHDTIRAFEENQDAAFLALG